MFPDLKTRNELRERIDENGVTGTLLEKRLKDGRSVKITRRSDRTFNAKILSPDGIPLFELDTADDLEDVFSFLEDHR